jgi:hypothetical protein
MLSKMQRQDRGGVFFVVVIATLALFAACGRAADGSGATTASATRTQSPSPGPSPSSPPVPGVKALTASNCSGPAPATQPQAQGSYYTIRPPTNWTKTGNYVHTETLLLELSAPQPYGYAPTRIQLHSNLGPVHTVYGPEATSHTIAQQHAAAIAREISKTAVAGTLGDCNVGGAPAAAFGFSDDRNSGFIIYVVHGESLFEIILVGVGGISSQAIQDFLGMIGTLTWTL